MASFLFYFFSGTALLTAVFVVTHPKPTRALMALIGTMFSLAVLYLLLGAPFVAMVHLIVYAGAVLVLFLFVIMLLGIQATEIPLKSRFKLSHLLAGSMITGFLFFILLHIIKNAALPQARGVIGSVEAVAVSLFGRFLLPFELISILIIVGIFAAVSLAKNEGRS